MNSEGRQLPQHAESEVMMSDIKERKERSKQIKEAFGRCFKCVLLSQMAVQQKQPPIGNVVQASTSTS